MEGKEIDAYVKYNYFHKEQKHKTQNNPFLVQNLFYNKEQDFYVCPMGQPMTKVATCQQTSSNGYVSQVTYYQTQRCEGCPMRSGCHKASGNRGIQVNHRLTELRKLAKSLLTSEKGFSIEARGQ